MSASIRETLGLEKPNAGVEVKKSKSKRQASLRLELTLGQSTADTFPEFSYARLVEKEVVSIVRADFGVHLEVHSFSVN